nr:MAG TPA: hypothetical protein [Bacteriophage sp.]
MISCNTFTPPPEKLSEYLATVQHLQLDWRCI